MTVKDIARLAGVSPSTVSRVLNSPDNSFASEKVRNRIWDVVHETGYVPNPTAKSLRKSGGGPKAESNKNLACILAKTRRPQDNPFFAEIARAAEQQALQMGYAIPYYFTLFDASNQSVIQRVLSTDIGGVFALGRFDSSSTLDFLSSRYETIVYSGITGTDNNWDQVICNGYEIARTAMRHLLDYGHTRIGYVGETRHEIRFTGYKDALTDAGLPFSPDLIGRCTMNGEEGYAAANALISHASRLPTAIFCANDITAISVLRLLRKKGLRVPADISLMGADDIPMSSVVTPSLSTVSVPKGDMGRLAIRVLIDRINKMHRLPMKIFLPYKLIIRESTRKIT